MASTTYLRRQIRTYEKQITQYNSTKTKLQTISSELGEAYSIINPIENTVSTNFKIDDSSADNGTISTLKNDCRTHREKIDSTVIPAITKKVDELSAEITRLEEEIERLTSY